MLLCCCWDEVPKSGDDAGFCGPRDCEPVRFWPLCCGHLYGRSYRSYSICWKKCSNGPSAWSISVPIL